MLKHIRLLDGCARLLGRGNESTRLPQARTLLLTKEPSGKDARCRARRCGYRPCGLPNTAGDLSMVHLRLYSKGSSLAFGTCITEEKAVVKGEARHGVRVQTLEVSNLPQ